MLIIDTVLKVTQVSSFESYMSEGRLAASACIT